MTEHTPTPWKVDDGIFVVGADDAEYIVRAVNAHDALLLAALDALSGWRYIRAVYGDMPGVGWERVEAALRDAIALTTEAVE